MRICVLQSSFEGSKSVFDANESMPDPGHYVDSEHHTFEQRHIRKFAEKDDIDKVVAEGFDMYWNFMWGQLYDDVSGIEATRYLESKGVPLVGSPSDYMAFTKQDLALAAERAGTFRVPGNQPDKWPKMVKFVDGMASIGMDEDSVCYSQADLDAKIAALKQIEPNRDILVQDFIRGIETTAIVVEMGSEVVSLPPVDWVFSQDVPIDKAWLSFTSKFQDLEAGRINFRFVDDESRREKICAAGVAAFKALGLQGRGCWGRIDARVDYDTGEVYCLEMNHLPAIFFPQNEAMSDDIILRQTYPGGPEAFIDMVLYTKNYQMSRTKIACASTNGVVSADVNGAEAGVFKQAINGNENMAVNSSHTASTANGFHQETPNTNGSHHNDLNTNGYHDAASSLNEATTNGHSSIRASHSSSPKRVGDLKAHGMTIADVYNSAAPAYDDVQAKMAIRQWQIQYFKKYNYAGTVLDLACGTGGIGMLIMEAGNDAKIHGVDVSPVSLNMPLVQKYYSSTSCGFLQDEVMGAGSYDHIVCFGALHFLDRVSFVAALSRMFMLARKSVAFDVDDVSQEYIDKIISCFGEGLRNHNHMRPYQRFGTPPGWKKVQEETRSLFYSPSVKIDVAGIVVRFEKI